MKSSKNTGAWLRIQKLTAVLLLLAVAFLLPGVLPRAAAADAVTVRVGYFYNGDFMHVNADGTYSGYDIEYYDTIAGYAGWKIQFVPYSNLQAALRGLKRGDIDIMSGLSKTPQREQDFLVSSNKMCTSRIAVQTRADDDRFTAGDPRTMQNLTCGILKGSNVVALYKNWCAENGLTAHIREYNSLERRNTALFAGEVDAIAAGSSVENAQKIAEFPALDLYFMLNQSRRDLKTVLDRSMGILALEDPTYTSALFEKYFPSTRNSRPSFSAAEKRFIAARPVVRAAVLKDDAPFSLELANGTVEGILPEYYTHLSSLIGFQIQCVPYASTEAAFQALHDGKVDLVGKLGNDVFDAVKKDVILTVPFLKMNLVQITRAGTGTVSRAAVPLCTRDAAKKALLAGSSRVSLVGRANSEACFESLKSRRVDAVICTQTAASWLLNQNRASSYVVSSFGSDTWDISAALPASETGNMLRSIFNKVIAIDNGYINQLITNDTLRDSADLSHLVDRLPVPLLAVFAAVAALLLVMVSAALLVLLRHRQAEQALAEQKVQLAAEEERNRAKHTFFGTVSHDMRTPLNGIMGFTDLALESDDPEQVKKYLGKIRASGSVLTNLVSDTLLMSRLENGKYTLSPAPCDLPLILDEALEPIREIAREKGVALRDNLTDVPHCQVLTDRLSLQKILLNLLSNAVKFTPSGGTVTLHCTLRPESGGQVDSVISVSDTGSGISQEFLPHIFEPFSQEFLPGQDISGSGMGLSIVKSIADAMGGTISVSSRQGIGSEFTLHLRFPAVKPAAPSAAVQTAGDSASLRGRQFLVCEDNPLNFEILKSILVRWGAGVTGAENGELGVEAFAASPCGFFSAILLDLRMPVMDGTAAAAAIREMDRADAKTVPIYAVSADAYPENVRECLDAGMNGHIAKPVDPKALLQILSQL